MISDPKWQSAVTMGSVLDWKGLILCIITIIIYHFVNLMFALAKHLDTYETYNDMGTKVLNRMK